MGNCARCGIKIPLFAVSSCKAVKWDINSFTGWSPYDSGGRRIPNPIPNPNWKHFITKEELDVFQEYLGKTLCQKCFIELRKQAKEKLEDKRKSIKTCNYCGEKTNEISKCPNCGAKLP